MVNGSVKVHLYTKIYLTSQRYFNTSFDVSVVSKVIFKKKAILNVYFIITALINTHSLIKKTYRLLGKTLFYIIAEKLKFTFNVSR